MPMPQVVMGIDDLERAIGVVKDLKDPLGALFRFAGLSATEQRAGVPVWAWAAVALGAGLYIGVQHGPEIKHKLGM